MSGKLPADFAKAMAEYKQKLAADKPKVASRKASQMALEVINKAVPETLAGSADLTHSNLTNTPETLPFQADNRLGRYMMYGIREHEMAAAMNGVALHGGLIPYGGTFMVFTDYARPSIRLSALMEQRVIYVMTHDSIGLGEDGPTHQPVEHLSALRAIPNLLVFRRRTPWKLPSAGNWRWKPMRPQSWRSPARTCRPCAPSIRPRTSRPRAPTALSAPPMRTR